MMIERNRGPSMRKRMFSGARIMIERNRGPSMQWLGAVVLSDLTCSGGDEAKRDVPVGMTPSDEGEGGGGVVLGCGRRRKVAREEAEGCHLRV